MKKVFLTALAALFLGISSESFAQGSLPPTGPGWSRTGYKTTFTTCTGLYGLKGYYTYVYWKNTNGSTYTQAECVPSA